MAMAVRLDVRLVARDGGQVVLARPPGDAWNVLPGGPVETGEGIEPALARHLDGLADRGRRAGRPGGTRRAAGVCGHRPGLTNFPAGRTGCHPGGDRGARPRPERLHRAGAAGVIPVRIGRIVRAGGRVVISQPSLPPRGPVQSPGVCRVELAVPIHVPDLAADGEVVRAVVGEQRDGTHPGTAGPLVQTGGFPLSWTVLIVLRDHLFCQIPPRTRRG